MNSNGPFWQGATGVWHAHQAPVVAILTAVLIAFAARRWRVRADAAGALGVAVGWAALLAPTTIHAVFAPRSLPEHLMFVGLMGVLAAIVRPYAPGRLNKAVPLAVAMLAGWWLARSAPGRPEFWRVGLVITIAALGLARIVGTEASRASTAAVAMAGALLAEGAPSIWTEAAFVPASVALGLWAVSPTALLLPFAVAVVAAGASADLAAGRLVHGGWGAIDGAMLAPFFALGLAPVLTRRLGRAGPLGAATFAVLAIWGVQRLVLHR